MEKIIDAKERTIGRVASEAAVFLMGKNSADYARNIKPINKVTIINASKAKITGNKMIKALHEKYSGYPGGFTEKTKEKIIETKGYAELFKLAVYGMISANKLRPIAMKNLTINE